MKRLILVVITLFAVSNFAFGQDEKNSITPFVGGGVFFGFIDKANNPFSIIGAGPVIGLEYSRKLSTTFWLGVRAQAYTFFTKNDDKIRYAATYPGAALVLSGNLTPNIVLHGYAGYPFGMGISLWNHTLAVEMYPIPVAICMSYGYRFAF